MINIFGPSIFLIVLAAVPALAVFFFLFRGEGEENELFYNEE